MSPPSAADVLRTLADLVPTARAALEGDLVDVSGGRDPFAWLARRVDLGPLFGPEPEPVGVGRDQAVRRLQAVDSLHAEERVLRAGFLYLCGRVEIGGRPRRVCAPLLVRPVRTLVGRRNVVLEAAGEVELGFDVDAQAAAGLERAGLEFAAPGRYPRLEPRVHEPEAGLWDLLSWVAALLDASGLPKAPIAAHGSTPTGVRKLDHAEVLDGYGLHVDRRVRPGARADRLAEWAGTSGIAATAFAALYVGDAAASAPARSGDRPSALPLTDAQRSVLARAEHERIVCVSGAPGTGKSHLVCALAIDAAARGHSVLIATPTPYASDVLVDLLRRQPGPLAVSFGEGERRQAMGRALEAAAAASTTREEILAADAALRDARDRYASATADVARELDREARAARAVTRSHRLPELRELAPAAFDPGAELAAIAGLVARVRARDGWWRRRQARRACGAARAVTVDELAEAVEAARDVRADAELAASGGTTIGEAWNQLLDAEHAVEGAYGTWVDATVRSHERWDVHARRSVAALGRALAAGRRSRRELLRAIDAGALVRALPLWVGTLRDVEDLLPLRPNLFDLVIVDEAAQVEQQTAASALLRGARAVVVGDPRQLRPVSWVADADVGDALAQRGVEDLADRLDVRRMALYDVAAGATEITWLDEHFRSVPHLIAFSAHRFYDDRVLVATRNPVNEAEDAIDVVRVPAGGEAGAVVEAVAGLLGSGATSVGAITPFRDLADDIEAGLVDRFEPGAIAAAGLRAGTAHSFQGGERDHVVVALGLDPDAGGTRWRFVEDPNLFNVLVTRGRRHLTVVTALGEDVRPGIVADFLANAASPPPRPAGDVDSQGWIGRLAAELAALGVTVRPGYRVGRWTVDICAGDGAAAVALDCVPHPDGPAAHIARHRGLRLAGWRVVDAFPSRWDGEPVRAAIDLAAASIAP